MSVFCEYVKRTHKSELPQAIDLKRLHEIRVTQTADYPIDFKSEDEIRPRNLPALPSRQPRLTRPRQRAIVSASLQIQRPGLEARTFFRRTAPTIFM